MVQSVELLMDDATDALVRAEWDRLLEAGLPSQARHTGASNRPHITLGVAASLSARDEDAIAAAIGPLPLPVRLGGHLIFGSGPFVLARAVVPTVDLLTFQKDIAAALPPPEVSWAGSTRHQAAGGWTAHVTLARRVTSAQVAQALTVLAPVDDLDAEVVAVRRWDGERKAEWRVSGI